MILESDHCLGSLLHCLYILKHYRRLPEAGFLPIERLVDMAKEATLDLTETPPPSQEQYPGKSVSC